MVSAAAEAQGSGEGHHARLTRDKLGAEEEEEDFHHGDEAGAADVLREGAHDLRRWRPDPPFWAISTPRREPRQGVRPEAETVNSFPPIQQISMKNGYDENNNYNKSDETKCATNYSFITNNNKWNVNTHNNMQLTKHDTNDDVDFDNCVVHTVR